MAYWNGTHWVPEGLAEQPPRRAHRLWGAVTEASLVTLLIFGLIAGGVLAGKPTSRGGGRGDAALTFESASTPVAVGTQYTVVVTGLGADSMVTVGAYYADTTWWGSGRADGSGNLRVSFTASSAGAVLHEAKQVGNNGRLRLVGSATLNVEP